MRDCRSIENPPTPFNFAITQGGMPAGAEVSFKGILIDGPNKGFCINLLGYGDDIALHLNPRFKFFEHEIVLNSHQQGSWQNEERYENPLRVGHEFRLRLLNDGHQFSVDINGVHLCNFVHRLVQSVIRAIEVQGDVKLEEVRLYNFVDPDHHSNPYGQLPPSVYPPAPPPLGGIGQGASAPPLGLGAEVYYRGDGVGLGLGMGAAAPLPPSYYPQLNKPPGLGAGAMPNHCAHCGGGGGDRRFGGCPHCPR